MLRSSASEGELTCVAVFVDGETKKSFLEVVLRHTQSGDRDINKRLKDLFKILTDTRERVMGQQKHYRLLQPSPTLSENDDLLNVFVSWVTQERVALYHEVYSEKTLQYCTDFGFLCKDVQILDEAAGKKVYAMVFEPKNIT